MQRKIQKVKRFVRNVLGKHNDCCHASHQYVLTGLLLPGDDATGMLVLKENSPVGMSLSYTMLKIRMSASATTNSQLLYQHVPLPC